MYTDIKFKFKTARDKIYKFYVNVFSYNFSILWKYWNNFNTKYFQKKKKISNNY